MAGMAARLQTLQYKETAMQGSKRGGSMGGGSSKGGRASKTVDPFYKSPGWFKARQKCLIRDGYKCVNCGASVRGKGQARVDHKLPRKKFPDQALHLPNLRTLCIACDNARHTHDRALHGSRGEVQEIGADGFPTAGPWANLTDD